MFEPTVKSLLANVEILLSGKYDEAEEIQIRFVFLLWYPAFVVTFVVLYEGMVQVVAIEGMMQVVAIEGMMQVVAMD